MVKSTGASPPYDTLLSRGTLIDGTGGGACQADVAIKGDRIVAIGKLRGARAAEEIDIQGKCLTPGFVDTHTHDDQACMARAAQLERQEGEGRSHGARPSAPPRSSWIRLNSRSERTDARRIVCEPLRRAE